MTFKFGDKVWTDDEGCCVFVGSYISNSKNKCAFIAINLGSSALICGTSITSLRKGWAGRKKGKMFNRKATRDL